MNILEMIDTACYELEQRLGDIDPSEQGGEEQQKRLNKVLDTLYELKHKRAVYVVLETLDSTQALGVYATREDAVKHIEERTGKKEQDWDNYDGTSYVGDSSYDYYIWLEEVAL